ncbi:MAG: YfhO family protein [Pseudomonadota bacterium]
MKKNILPIILLFFLTLLYFAPVVFTDKTFIARDNYIFYNPRQSFAAETLRSGSFPLWNPYIACGVPFQANLQNSIFYPLSAIYYLLTFQKGFKYFIVLHYFLGAFFMFLLARMWGCSRKAAFISGLVFAFGGYLASINDNVAFLTSGIWLPLILLSQHCALRSGTFFFTILTGIAVAMQVFAGDASFFLLSSLISTFIYTLLWPYMQAGTQPCKKAKTWTQFIVTWAIGLALPAVQLVPFVEFVMHTPRFKGLSFEQAGNWSYHPLEMLQLIVPYIFGCSVPETRWFGQLWLDTFYIGVFPLIFAVLFIFYGKTRIKYFIITLLTTSLFLAMGKYNPCFIYLYHYVPGISMLQFPVKFLFLAAFSLAIMAGGGVDCICRLFSARDSLLKILKILTAFLALLTLCLLGATFFTDSCYKYFLSVYPQTEYAKAIADNEFFLLYQGVSIAICLIGLFIFILWAVVKKWIMPPVFMMLISVFIFADLYFVGKPKDPYVSESLFYEQNRTIQYLKQDSSDFRVYSLARFQSKRSFLHVYYLPFERVYRALKESLQANTNMYDRIYSAEEYSDLLNNDFYDVFGPVEFYFSEGMTNSDNAAYCRKVFSLLNVKYIVSPFAIKDFGFNLVLDGPIKVYQNPGVLPRAFFVDRLSIVNSEDDVVSNMKKQSYIPGEVAYITSRESQKINKDLVSWKAFDSAIPFDGSAEIIDNKPNRVLLRARANRQVFLILSDTFYPGWRAWDNGVEVSILKVNHTLRGLLISEGDHEILFMFKPVTFIAGMYISLAALTGVIVCLVLLIKNRAL